MLRISLIYITDGRYYSVLQNQNYGAERMFRLLTYILIKYRVYHGRLRLMTLCFLALMMPSQSQGTFDSDQPCPPPGEVDLQLGVEKKALKKLWLKGHPQYMASALSFLCCLQSLSPQISAAAGLKSWGQGNWSDPSPPHVFDGKPGVLIQSLVGLGVWTWGKWALPNLLWALGIKAPGILTQRPEVMSFISHLL